MNARRALLTGLALGFALPGAGHAQSASSQRHVLLQSELSDGRAMASSRFGLSGAFGVGPVAERSSSSRFRLEGGFTANLQNPTATSPWLTGVRPVRATINAVSTLTVHGTNLDRGLLPQVTVGGANAQIKVRSPETLVVDTPPLAAPGWHPITLTSTAGRSTIPKALAVLPMIETRPAPAANVPFSLIFRGTRGDRVLWVLGIGRIPLIQFPGIRYGFGIQPPNFIVYSGFSITDPSGELALPFPPTQYGTGTIFLQAMFLSGDSAYGPATFSNVLRI